ncbi:MAG: SprT family zinc-dependent metalloprotease [Pseudomonadota bacterium]|nr:SprT family zinc-dependent metalloprotease [Pseudomonadota bacterium]
MGKPTFDVPFPVKLKRNRRARKISLTIDAVEGGALLVLPIRATLQEGENFLQRQTTWILEELGRLPPHRPFNDGATFPLLGKQHRIRHLPLLPAQIQPEGQDLVVGGYTEPNTKVIKWLKEFAKSSLKEASISKAKSLKVRPPQISIRDPKTRWGSCSQGGSISFSWRLVLAPPWVMDYVISHEIAHILQFNHSNEFWALVRSVCPRYKLAKLWLKTNGPLLLRYG